MAGSLAQFLETAAFGVLNDVLSGFHSNNGYAVPNRFEALIIPPTAMGKNSSTTGSSGLSKSSSDGRAVSLRVESILLPGRNLNTLTDSNIYGPTREIVDGVTYADDIKVSFQASSDLAERRFFEEWQKIAFNEKTWDVGYYNDYIAQIELYLLDRQDKRRFGIKLWECFPKTIDGTELNQGTNNEIIKNDVSFSFRYWTQLDITAQPTSITDRLVSTFFGTVERRITGSIPKILNRL
tara:strand:- start:106 stop:819 length:714 start_codon:yes stop_codon:yes gene_type:complete